MSEEPTHKKYTEFNHPDVVRLRGFVHYDDVIREAKQILDDYKRSGKSPESRLYRAIDRIYSRAWQEKREAEKGK